MSWTAVRLLVHWMRWSRSHLPVVAPVDERFDAFDTDGWRDAVSTDEHDVPDREDADEERQQRDVPHQHLAGVEDVEHGADADRVQSVLGLGADPLGVEVG